MTECPLISRGKRGDNVKKSVGKLLPNMTAKVVDPNGHNVGPNTPGELYIRCCSQTKILKTLSEQTMFHVAIFLSSRIRIHHDPNFSKKYGDKYTLRIYLV